MITFTNDIDIGANNLYVGVTGSGTLDDRRVVSKKFLETFAIKAASNGVLSADNEWLGINTFAKPVILNDGLITTTPITGGIIYATTIYANNVVNTTGSATNVSATNVSATNVSATNVLSANVSATWITGTNIRSTNVTATNVSATNVSATNVLSANVSATWITGTNISATTTSTATVKTNSIGYNASSVAGSAMTIDASQNVLFTEVPSSNRNPTKANDLATKAYVDSVTPVSAYLLYLNKTVAFDATYSTLSPTQLISDISSSTICTTAGTEYLIGGFYSTLSALQFGASIPAGYGFFAFTSVVQ